MEALKLAELRDMLKARGLPTTGRKVSHATFFSRTAAHGLPPGPAAGAPAERHGRR